MLSFKAILVRDQERNWHRNNIVYKWIHGIIMNRVRKVWNELINWFKVGYGLFIALFGPPFVMYVKQSVSAPRFRSLPPYHKE